MEQQAEWVGEVQEQEQRLEGSVKDLKPQLGRTEALARDLKQQQQARERQRGPERDYGLTLPPKTSPG